LLACWRRSRRGWPSLEMMDTSDKLLWEQEGV
jgi:hypothetical protein